MTLKTSSHHPGWAVTAAQMDRTRAGRDRLGHVQGTLGRQGSTHAPPMPHPLQEGLHAKKGGGHTPECLVQIPATSPTSQVAWPLPSLGLGPLTHNRQAALMVPPPFLIPFPNQDVAARPLGEEDRVSGLKPSRMSRRCSQREDGYTRGRTSAHRRGMYRLEGSLEKPVKEERGPGACGGATPA